MKRFVAYGARGNAAPETALVLSFTLLMLFGLVQFATATFYQVSADGASFVAAHDTVQSVGAPTSANLATAQSSASGVFSKIVAGSIAVLNPSTSTFETDVTQQVPGISALGNPNALTITSRLIEESGSTASSSAAPGAIDCTQAALNIANGGNNSALNIVNQAIGLTQASGITVPVTVTANGQSQTALSLNPAPVVSEIGNINTVESNLSTTVTTLKGLPATLTTTLNAIPGVGLFSTYIENAISTTLEKSLSDALTLTGSTTSTTFSTTSELASVDLSIQNIPGLGSLLAALVVPAVNTLLTGGGTGILGTTGPLAKLNAAEVAIAKADSTLEKTCALIP